jgi:hypothetical protein
MLWVPALNVLTASVPVSAAKVEDPIAVPPSANVTVPVGEELPEVGATFALRVIACPNAAVVGVAVRVVAVACSGAAVTCTDTAFDVDAPSVVSPA